MSGPAKVHSTKNPYRHSWGVLIFRGFKRWDDMFKFQDMGTEYIY